MLVIGPVSSVFDFLTFARCQPSAKRFLAERFDLGAGQQPGDRKIRLGADMLRHLLIVLDAAPSGAKAASRSRPASSSRSADCATCRSSLVKKLDREGRYPFA
jgi:hypothetical protein